MNSRSLHLGFLVLGTALALAAPVSAAPRRMAVVLGNNHGAPGDLELRYATRDAAQVAQVLRELGGVAHDDLTLLQDGDAGAARAALQKAAARAGEGPGEAVLLFYYSGHADHEALHLGPTPLTWAELRALLAGSKASLRIALVDACQAANLTRGKGFSVGPKATASEGETSRGTAVLVSADSTEAAQESGLLGGSFFTHFLVSGLRGAADADGDLRVTLAETHAYTTRHTVSVTSGWARAAQHPVFDFDLTGHGDIVLSDLRAGVALLRFEAPMAGEVVVAERATGRVVAEARKAAGTALNLSLPAGRYLAHLRTEAAVYLSEVSLPWGGEVALSQKAMVPQSYQMVAQKGLTLELHRHRLRLGGSLQSGIVQGMGALVVPRLGYGAKFAPFELGVRVLATRTRFATVDSVVRTDLVGVGAHLAYEQPLETIDLRGWLVVEGQYWRQSVERQGERTSLVPGAGLGGGVRVPLYQRLFAEGSLETLVYLPNLQDVGVTARPTVAAELSIGVSL